MKKKLSEPSLRRILADNEPFDEGCLEKLIFEEAAKPAGESDIELINSALDALLKADGLEVPEMSGEVPFDAKPAVVDRARDRFFSYRIPKKWKNFVAACSVLLVVVCANALSTFAFGFNFTEELLSWSDDEVVISMENAEQEEEATAYEEIVSQMAMRGNWNFLLPEYLPEEMDLVGYSVSPSDTEVTVTVFLKSDTGETLSIVSHNYSNEMMLKDNSAVSVAGRYTLGDKKLMGSHTVFEVMGEKGNSAVFTDSLSIYVLTTSYNQYELDRIIMGMLY